MTNIQKYLGIMQNIQHHFLEYIDNQDIKEENYQNLIQFINDNVIHKDKHEFKSILYLISKISNNHYRSQDFFSKIIQILRYLKSDITKNFSNFEVFNIFKKSKAILLFLIKEKIIEINQKIANKMTNYKYRSAKYPQFFYKEIQPFFNDKNFEIPENFEENRKIGENEDYICKLIREDLIEEFIIYVNKTTYSLKNSIKPSIYETNLLLIQNKTSLIEYAAFFGSIQIFKYLFMNGVELTPSLWIYAIHSQNEELIHLLEEKNVQPKFKSFEKCLEEAIKCHHNNVANYIQNNYFQDDKNSFSDQFTVCLKYYNFAFISKSLITELSLFDLIQYDYYTLVELILKERDNETDINQYLV